MKRPSLFIIGLLLLATYSITTHGQGEQEEVHRQWLYAEVTHSIEHCAIFNLANLGKFPRSLSWPAHTHASSANKAAKNVALTKSGGVNLAKNKESRGGKIKINILQFELDGSDETLQEGLRTVAETLNRSLSPGQRVITQVQAPTRLALNGAPIQEELNEQEIEPEDEQPVVTTQARARSPRQYPKMEVLDDVDLKTDVSFENFCDGKDLSADYKRCLQIAAWFKEHRSLPEITANHAYTVYRFMNWNVPRDLGQIYREMKSKKGWFSNASSGKYALNHVGLNEALKTSDQG